MSDKGSANMGLVNTVKKFLLNLKAISPFVFLKFREPAEPVQSKLVFILSFPRSGTHAIGSLLTSKPHGFHYYGEFFIFNAWNSNIEKFNHYYPFFSLRYALNLKKQRRGWKYDRWETTSLDARKTLQSIKKLPGTHIIKIFPQHLSDPLLQSLIEEFKPHIIFLRRNHLDRFVSHKKANATGKWHSAPTSDVVVDLKVKEFDRFITNYTAFYERYAEFAPSVGCKVLDIGFDDLRDPVKVREIQEFAALPGFTKWDELAKAPTTVKQDKSSKVQDDFLASMNKKYSDFDFPKVGS
jgi:hypothetical protein